MDEDDIPEKPDGGDLNQREDGCQQGDNRIEACGPIRKELGYKRAEPAYHEPAEKDKGDGDLIARELGEEFPDGDDLNGYGGNPGCKDRCYEQVINTHCGRGPAQRCPRPL